MQAFQLPLHSTLTSGNTTALSCCLTVIAYHSCCRTRLIPYHLEHCEASLTGPFVCQTTDPKLSARERHRDVVGRLTYGTDREAAFAVSIADQVHLRERLLWEVEGLLGQIKERVVCSR